MVIALGRATTGLTPLLRSEAWGFVHVKLGLLGSQLRERFGLSTFKDPMVELVTLKQKRTAENYHDMFLSLLNQLQMPKYYVLSIISVNTYNYSGPNL